MNIYKIILDSAEITCKPNSILSSRVHNYLVRNGHEIVKNLSQADYIIINTCGFDKIRENISTDLFKKYVLEKKEKTKILSIGCLNEINKDGIKALVPEARFILNLDELDRVFYNKIHFKTITEACLDPIKINDLTINAKRGFDFTEKIYFILGSMFYAVTKPFPSINFRIKQVLDEVNKHNKFYVEISKGCVHNCSYCVIKKARGRLSSRGIDQIMQDIDRLYVPGKKLCFVADDCGSYGLDIGKNIFELIYAVNKNFPDLSIDLCYLNPFWIQKYEAEYINLFKNVSINSVNISIQSGSDKIIQAMNRNYAMEKIVSIIKELKNISPNTLIWTHIIIGFPGESSSDFKKTMSILGHFDCSSKFIYSDRAGTASSLMKNKVPPRIKSFRKLRLQAKESNIFVQRFVRCVLKKIKR